MTQPFKQIGTRTYFAWKCQPLSSFPRVQHSVSSTRSCNVCLTHVAWGTTASWSSTGRRSSPKRMLSSQKVCVALSCFTLFPSTSSCSPLVIASWLCTPAFSQLLSGLWDENEGDTAVNPRQFYNLFKEAVPYFSGYRWGRREVSSIFWYHTVCYICHAKWKLPFEADISLHLQVTWIKEYAFLLTQSTGCTGVPQVPTG